MKIKYIVLLFTAFGLSIQFNYAQNQSEFIRALQGVLCSNAKARRCGWM
jgi:hypothetical protein